MVQSAVAKNLLSLVFSRGYQSGGFVKRQIHGHGAMIGNRFGWAVVEVNQRSGKVRRKQVRSLAYPSGADFGVVSRARKWHCLLRGGTHFLSQLLEIDGRVTSLKTQRPHAGKSVSARSELLLQLHLQSNPEALCLVRATVQRAAEVLHFPEHESRAIVRSVDEALANIIRHAYRGRVGMPIEVSCWRLWNRKDPKTPKGLQIVLSDSGDPAKPQKLRGRALNEVRPGGLGLHFIKQSMDVVEFSRKDGKNLLRLVKYLASPKPEAALEGE